MNANEFLTRGIWLRHIEPNLATEKKDLDGAHGGRPLGWGEPAMHERGWGQRDAACSRPGSCSKARPCGVGGEVVYFPVCASPLFALMYSFSRIFPQKTSPPHTPLYIRILPTPSGNKTRRLAPVREVHAWGKTRRSRAGGRRFWPAFGAGEPEADGLFSSQGVGANPALLAQLKALCSPCSSIHPSEHGTPMFRQPNPTGGSWI